MASDRTPYTPVSIGASQDDKPQHDHTPWGSLGFFGKAKYLWGNHGGKIGINMGLSGTSMLGYAFWMVLHMAALTSPMVLGFLIVGSILITAGLAIGVSAQFAK